MATQDPFAKEDEKNTDAPMKEEFVDFGDPMKDNRSGGRKKMFIIFGVLFLVLGALVVGYMFMQGEEAVDDATQTALANRPKTLSKAENNANLSAQPLPPINQAPPATEHPPAAAAQTPPSPPAPSLAPAPTAQLAPGPKLETPSMPGRTAHKPGHIEVAPIKTEKTAQELPKKTKAQEKADAKAAAAGEATVAAGEEEGAAEVEEEEAATEPPSLASPANGAERDYDESAAMPRFTWAGKASWISFSKNPKMHPAEIKAKVKSEHYEMPRLTPGVWYWQVGNSAGKSAVRTFTVHPPSKRAVALVEPLDGATLIKDNGMVSWKGDHMITYYRVELSSQGWANPNYRFATTGTQMKVHDVPQGNYEMRVGAFSEVSGRWEYTNPIKVSIQ